MKITQLSRISHHTITATGSSFSVPSQEDFTIPGGMSGSWTPYDLALSEIGVLENEGRAFIRIGGSINEFSFGGGTGSGTSGVNGTSGTSGLDGTSGTSGLDGTSGLSPIVGATMAYGSFYDTATHSHGGATESNGLFFDSSVDYMNIGWSYSAAPTTFTLDFAGVYTFHLNLQVKNASPPTDYDTQVWMVINGTEVNYSRQSFWCIDDVVNDINWNWTGNINNGDIVSFYWWSSDTTAMLKSDAADTDPVRPAYPSASLSINKVSLFPRSISDDGTTLRFLSGNDEVMALDAGSVSIFYPLTFQSGYTQSTALQFGSTDTGIYSSTDGYVSFKSNGTLTAEINEGECYLNVNSGDQIYISQGAGISLYGLNNGVLVTGTTSFQFAGLNPDEILYTDALGVLKSKEYGNFYTPISGTDSYGYDGQLTYDNDYIYVKSSGLWRRTAVSSW